MGAKKRVKREWVVGARVRCISLERQNWMSRNWTEEAGCAVGDTYTVDGFTEGGNFKAVGICYILDKRNFELV